MVASQDEEVSEAPRAAGPGPVPRWEHFEHMADIGVRGVGTSPAQAFEQAALAMVAVITSPAKVRPVESVTVSCRAADPELLLVDWLNTLVYEMASRGMLFSRFDVRVEDGRLDATVRGESTDRRRHDPAVEVKGATLTELSVHRDAEGHWVAQCVVDV